MARETPDHYRPTEWCCPWCPSIAQGDVAIMAHLEADHPSIHAELMREQHADQD